MYQTVKHLVIVAKLSLKHDYKNLPHNTIFEQEGIQVSQLVADLLIRLLIRTCVKTPVLLIALWCQAVVAFD